MAVYIWPPVSVTTLPPLGGATSANQLLEITELEAINLNTAGAMKILRNGVLTEVEKDTTVPSNTIPVPVEIVAATGQEMQFNIAGDAIVNITDMGTNYSAIRLGDGTGNYAGITPSDEVQVFDANAATELGEINTEITQLNAKTPNLGQALEAASSPVVLPATQVTALTPPAAITGFNLETTQLDVKAAVESLNTKLPAQGQALEAASTPVVLPVAQITALTPPAAITGFALEATLLLIQAKTDNLDIPLSDISAKLPAALGPDAGAASLSIVPATDAEFTVVQKAPALPGSDESQNVNHTSGYTFMKPTDAKNMVIFNNAGDPVANRIRFGQAPDWAMGLGAILGVGNSTALLPASSFKAVAEDVTSNANVSVLWFY